MQEALGVIETLGFATAVLAADSAVKAANVRLCDLAKVGGGLAPAARDEQIARPLSQAEPA
jgi:microcompartment protein CcmL/EutN